MLVVQPIISGYSMSMRLDLSMMRPGSQETAQTAFDGARYYRTATGVYLKDFGRGDSDDSAKLYSGQMLDFDGVDDHVTTGCSLVSGDNYTLLCTMSTDDITSTYQRILYNYFGLNGIRVHADGKIQAWLRDSGDNEIYLYSDPLVNGTIYRIVLVANNSTGDVSLYLNDILVDSASSLGGFKYLNNNFQMGDSSHVLDGLLGNVQIWDAAFDADDVAWDYANCHLGLTADNRSGTDLVAANLKGHWKLIEGAGDVAYDYSGNGNHGTLTNFPGDGTGWSNADALDDPIVCQTALIEWALKTSNNACVPLDTAASTNFTRNYSELNWNGRSYPAGMTGADVTGVITATVEMVVNLNDVTALQYLLDGQKTAGTGYIRQTTGTIAVSSGTVYVDGSATTTIVAGLCHVVVSGISLDASELFMLIENDLTNVITGQLAILKIYEETWDAAKVTKFYNKAAAKYGL